MARKKGRDIVACDVSEPLAIADIFLIVSANNERLVGAIVDAIETVAGRFEAGPGPRISEEADA